MYLLCKTPFHCAKPHFLWINPGRFGNNMQKMMQKNDAENNAENNAERNAENDAEKCRKWAPAAVSPQPHACI